jgi:hypothetical protein
MCLCIQNRTRASLLLLGMMAGNLLSSILI